MLFIDSAHDLVRYWDVRDFFKNEALILETTRQCGYQAFLTKRQDVPSEVLGIPELHQAWIKGWRAALAKSRKTAI